MMASAEKYLLDSNVLIQAQRQFYAFDIALGFWRQLEKHLISSDAVILSAVKNELMKNHDPLTDWLKSVKGLNFLDEMNEADIVMKYADVMNFLRTSAIYKDTAKAEWAAADVADPWLIAAAAVRGYVLITFETSVIHAAPIGTQYRHVKIPDVARNFGVRCEDLYYFMRKSGIRWR